MHLFLLMRQAAAGPGQALEEMPVPWGRCYTPDEGRVYLLAPSGLRVPFLWAGPSDGYCPAVVGNTPPCTVASPWCAVVEGAACLLMDLPDPVEAAAALLQSQKWYQLPLLLSSQDYSLYRI